MFDIVDNNERRERIRNLIDQMQEIIRDPYQTENETILELEEQFIEEIRSVNKDLKECSNLLNKGLIPNVQQRARESDLLSRFNLLESIDRNDWIAILEISSLKFSDEELDIESEHQLNSCFAAGDRLEPHYREIRRLALEQAPIRNRLAEMRKVFTLLKKSHLGTHDWAEDIRLFEAERQKEVAGEIESAKAEQSLEKLKLLVKELAPGSWLNPPDPVLEKVAKSALSLVMKVASKNRLAALKEKFIWFQGSGKAESDINNYYPQLKAAIEQWDKYQNIARLPLNDPIISDSQAAREYVLDRIREFELERLIRANIDEIGHLIDIEADRKEIENLVYELKSLYTELGKTTVIDEVLSKRYQGVLDRYETYEQSGKTIDTFWLRVKLVTAATAVIALAVVGWYFGDRYKTEQGYVSRETQLQELVENQKFEESDKYLQAAAEIKDDFLSRPKVQALVALHEKNQFDEQSRQSRVSTTIQNILNDVPSANSLTAISTLDSRLNDIASSVVLQREQSDLANAKTAILQRKGDVQAEIDTAFSNRLQSATDLLEKSKPEETTALQEVTKELLALQQTSDVSPELKRPLEPLLSRVQGMMKSEQTRKMQVDRLRGITEAIGSPSRFQTQLKSYVDAFTGAPRSLEFEKVIKEDQSAWTEILEWNKIAREWRRRDLSSPTREQAARYLMEAQQALQNYEHDPRAKNLDKVIPYLIAIQSRVTDDESIKSELLTLLQNPVIQIPYAILNEKNDRYYLDEIPIRAMNRYQFKYFTGLDVGEKKFEAIPVEKATLLREGTRIVWTSPQLAFAEKAQDQLNLLADAEYEKQMFGILEQLLTDNLIDPLLKIILFKAMGEIMNKGSLPMQTTLSPVLKLVEEAAIPTEVNYLDPANAEATIAREKAQRLLEKLEPVPNLLRAALEHKQKVSMLNPGPEYVWVGWVYKADDGDWSIEAQRPPSSSGSPLVVAVGNSDGTFQLNPIGVSKPGRYEIHQDVDPSLLNQGRAVFMVESSE